MSTRIRYKNEGGYLTSTKAIVCGLHNVKVELDTLNLTYRLIDVDSDDILAEGIATSVPMLKLTAKKELRKLGAVFGDEIRNHSTSEEIVIADEVPEAHLSRS